MTFESLKQIVYKAINKQGFTKDNDQENYVNKILAASLLFNIAEKLINLDSGYLSELTSTVESYAETYKNIAESLNEKYISYRDIERTILSYNLNSFLNINKKQIQNIIKLYENKNLIKEFDKYNYSQLMYNINKLSFKEDQILAENHYRVIVPLVEYYQNKFNIIMKNVKVETSEEYPGRVIKISISGVLTSQIYNDIENDVLNIRKYIYKYYLTEDGFVEIILK